MVKKKGDNPLAGLTRFNVDPMHVPEANKILGMQHRAAAREHDQWVTEYRTELAEKEAKKKKPKYTREQIMEGATDGANKMLSPSWNARADYFEKGMVTPFQWASPGLDRKGPLNYKGEPVQPDEYADDYYSYGIDTNEEAPYLQSDPFGVPRSDKEKTEWIGNDVRYRGYGAIRNNGRDLDPETIRGMYETSKTGMSSEDTQKPKYSTAIPHVSEEQTAKEALAYIKQVSPDDTKGIAETEALLSKIQKTGKVEEPALPQASEKPVAKKKKNEPDYIPSKSEKDFAAGRMPGITGTAEEAASALERTRKASTSKVTGKAKVKLQEEIAAHPMYRGTRQLSDEEVAANEAGDSAPKSTKKGSIRASESVAATAQTPKPKGKGKKKDLVPHPDIPGAMTDANEEPVSEKPYLDDPAETLAASKAKNNTVDVKRFDKPMIPAPASETSSKPAKNYADVEKVDYDMPNYGSDENYTGTNDAPKPAATAAPDKNKPGYYREKYGALLDSLTPEEKAQSEAAMDAVLTKEEAALDADEAERAGKSTPSSMPAPTAGTGVASPTPTWGAPTGAGVSSPTATPTGPTASPSMPLPLAPLPSSAGTGGPRSTPAPAPKVKGPGLGSRIGGFFGGHGGRGGGKAPAPAAGPSTSTSSANTTTINYGAPTFGDQTNLGRNDFGGGGGGAGGSGSINMSANSNQANQVQGQNVRIGGSYGGTVGGPVVASTSGRATSNNPRATVLSTGGPASQTQGHPRAQNAKRGGRPTTSNQTPTAPKTKNPRQQKP